MKARKVDLTAYALPHVTLPDQTHPNYDVRGSLTELCFVPELELTGTSLMAANKIAESIRNAPSDAMILSEQDWSFLASACQAHKGFTRNDVELVRRVLEAPVVDVEETTSVNSASVKSNIVSLDDAT